MTKSLEYYQQEVESKPNQSSSHYQLGQALAAQGKHSEAIAAYNRVVELNPKSVRGFRTLGNTYFELQEWRKAISNYKKAIDLKTDVSSNVYNRLAIALRKIGAFEQAIQLYKLIIPRNLQDDSLYLGLGRLLSLQEETKYLPGAISAYQKALELNSNQPSRVHKELEDLLDKYQQPNADD